MNALGYSASISDAEKEIEKEYKNENISEVERDWRLNHIMSY